MDTLLSSAIIKHIFFPSTHVLFIAHHLFPALNIIVCIPFLVLHLLTAPIPDTGTYSQSTHFQSFTCFQRISILPSKHSTERNWYCYSAFLHEAFFTCSLDKHYSNTVNLECSVWDYPQPQIQLWILNSSAN